MSEHVYRVDVSRDGRWWLVEIPEIDLAGQARNLDVADAVAKEVIGLALGLEPDGIEVAVEVRLPDEVERALAAAAEREAIGWAAVKDAAELRRSAVAWLIGSGVSQKDAARLLGVSPQRVSQLAH
ncbi:MAG: hypothetical protein LBO20_09815 [Bifidobacteriaceae bacterium]|nr:hypothetical protein [Bifidobacteriaceae bacterium]